MKMKLTGLAFGAVAAIGFAVSANADMDYIDLGSDTKTFELGPCSLFRSGEGGSVSAAQSAAEYLGTVIGADGVAGTVSVKMSKPNKRTGRFGLTATVETLDGSKYKFKAKDLSAPETGALTVGLPASDGKSRGHALTVTLEGDSLTGTFDGATIDCAKDAFKDRKGARAAAIAPFVGTWTGKTGVYSSSFVRMIAEYTDPQEDLYVSVAVKKDGSAKAKVLLPDGTVASCKTKALVGSSTVAVPVAVRKSAKGVVRTFGFQLVFMPNVSGEPLVWVIDVAPLEVHVKATGETARQPIALTDAFLLTMTAKAFKSYVVRTNDARMRYSLGPVTKNSLRFDASTGFVSGKLEWEGISGKAMGVALGDLVIGTVPVEIYGAADSCTFNASPAK